ncbi:Uncharacterised protein [Mycobacteroides abscessus subsp. abscessus]|nr:Uncharacterised protein [Mycobacteroides abscessus subsp. abscessus]
MGFPMFTGPPGVSGVPVAQMVDSLGPYALNMRRPGAQACTSSSGQASPPVIKVVSSSSRVRSRDATTVGVSSVALTRWCCIRSASASPAYTSRGATTNAAAAPVAISISNSDASNVGAATISTRASAVSSYESRCAAAAPSRPAWLTATPLGSPVEPDVKMT